MDKSKVNDYIQQGIYGKREINPDERRKFLGTLRERVVVVLSKKQVREKGTYEEVEELMKKNQEATLFLNGTMNYSFLSDYIKLANKVGTKFLISTDKEHETDLGLVLAYDYAIDKEKIYITKNQEVERDTNEEKSLKKFFKKLF
ncbi:YueI family protein [Bacillus weihaiensis]|uniref:YueI family protein n=1 Tax=Bacillus weihaiensis TaxID=1547283 RepID=UPI00235416BA|nr:YueI family protein [Bacillus weihaiensis]